MKDYLNHIKHSGFIENTCNGVSFFTVREITELGFIHGFTTRLGGVSTGAYKSLNLSKTRENNLKNKIENYRLICNSLGIDYNSLTLVNYEHGNNVYILQQKDRGAGITMPCNFDKCDAIIVNDPRITAVTLHADCTPIFIVDKKNRIASVAHSGWKGTVLGIAGKIVEKMNIVYNSQPADIIAAIGPHIMNCCFEIKEDVAAKIAAKDEKAIIYSKNKIYGDLQYLTIKQFYESNIPPENVICADLCTYCNEDLFYSHRRDNGITGAMGAFINIGS